MTPTECFYTQANFLARQIGLEKRVKVSKETVVLRRWG